MKKLIFLLFALFVINSAIAQGCLPEGITFTSQAEIDNFQVNYPGCTEIQGNVEISGTNITNLSGLIVLTTIDSSLSIILTSLVNLNGINNLSSIGGDFYLGKYGWGGLHGNPCIKSLTGLEELTFIGGSMSILGNDSLTSLDGLNNAMTIGKGILIKNNPNLSDCNAESICNYLASPNGMVDIFDNTTGCNTQSEVVSNCGGTYYCLPYGNYYFLSQADIDNFPINFSGCNDLSGTVSICGIDIANLNGLNQVTSISGSFQIGIYNFPSPVGNPSLTNLTGLDNLTYIGGDLFINYNESLENLTGLDNLTNIGGSLLIGLAVGGGDKREMPALASIAALGNITTIGKSLYIGQTALTNLYGLDSLTLIGGPFHLSYNLTLSSITSLGNVNSISGGLWISGNDALTSLSGLDNIAPDSITWLRITDNITLSTCEVRSICDYLANLNGNITIHDNATGCDSPAQVEAECETVTVKSNYIIDNYSLFPNPANRIVKIDTQIGEPMKEVTIYSLTGQKVYCGIPENNTLDISKLQPGIYVVEVVTKEGNVRKKLVVQ